MTKGFPADYEDKRRLNIQKFVLKTTSPSFFGYSSLKKRRNEFLIFPLITRIIADGK
jgi:hypothetical protein